MNTTIDVQEAVNNIIMNSQLFLQNGNYLLVIDDKKVSINVAMNMIKNIEVQQ